MKIEVNISSIEIRLNQKNQKLILRIIKMNNKHLTRLKTPRNFSSNMNHLNLLNPLNFFEPFKLPELPELPKFAGFAEPINALKNKNFDQFEN